MSEKLIFEEDKYHLTEFKVSLAKLQYNLDRFAEMVKVDCKFMLMIKADAYGYQSVALAKAFEKDERVSYFSISYTDEGIQLRNAGISKSIMILNPSPRSFEAIIEHCLEPEIHNLHLLKKFISFLKERKSEGHPYPVHLKFNTGMNRLGFNFSDIPELIKILSSQNVLRVQSMMTHLSSAQMESEDEFTLGQLKEFEKIVAETKEIQDASCFFHALNSAGICRFPEYQYQMVRLGIGLYGTSSIPQLKNSLKPAGIFLTKVSQVREVKKGDSISYSRSGRAEKDGKIATLALGYADGFSRHLGNGNWELEINGKLYPTIGNICMGLSMVDIGNDEVKIDDEVIIFGGKKSIYDYAEALDTITYEVSVSIGPRVKRILTA